MPQPSRREFLGTAAAAVAATALGSRAEAADRPPNILFIMTDQLDPRHLSCHGGPVPTPHIDRLAASGAHFTNAICAHPVCSASRASICLGQELHHHGIVLNVDGKRQQGLTPDDPTTEKLLYDAGYQTHHYGKWHLGGAQPYYPDTFDFGPYARSMAEDMAAARKLPDDRWMQFYTAAFPVTSTPELLALRPKLEEEWAKVPYADFILNLGRLDWPVEKHFDYQFASRAIDRLSRLDGRPFMVTCSMVAPHDPNLVPEPYYSLWDPAKVELPPTWNQPAHPYDRQWSRRAAYGLGEAGLREFLRVYWGMTKLIDDQVGRLLDALDRTGRADNTIVVFTADHGDMCCGHGMVWKSTDAFFDEVTCVPLMIRHPGRIKPQKIDRQVSLTDLHPTLLSLSGKQAPGIVDGHDLSPLLLGRTDGSELPEYRLCERLQRNPDGSRDLKTPNAGQFMVRGRDWKYIRYNKREHLYHLAEDRYETEDLAQSAEHREVKAKLAGALNEYLDGTPCVLGPLAT